MNLPAGYSPGPMLLLPDGDVMMNDGGQGASAGWHELVPDASGNYADGTVEALAPMSVSRGAFASDVLPNGDVFVFGGG